MAHFKYSVCFVSVILFFQVASSQKALAEGSLEQLLEKSRDPLIRETAALVLGVRGSKAAVPLLIKRLKEDDNKWVRARSAEALGRIGSPKALAPLNSALSKEKEEQVRRYIAKALLWMGQKRGIDELMWQIKSGTNHSKAESMTILSATFSQPLGQNEKAWWRYLSSKAGKSFLEKRPTGSPVTFELRGLKLSEKATRKGPYLEANKRFGWRRTPAYVIKLSPQYFAITAKTLSLYEKQNGPIPDGCLLFLQTDWLHAKPPRHQKQGGRKKGAKPGEGQKSPGGRSKAGGNQAIKGPGITPDAVEYLLKRAPQMLGLALDTPLLGEVSSPTLKSSVMQLIQRGKLVIESVGDMDRLPPQGFQVLVIPQHKKKSKGAHHLLLLVELP